MVERTLKDSIERWKNTSKWKRTYYNMRYKVKCFFDILQHFRNIKYFIQRGRRGWANCDCWGLDQYLAKVISESTKHLANNHSAYPSDLTDEEWTCILDLMSYYFSLVDTESLWDNVDIKNKKEFCSTADIEIAQLELARKNGMELLKEHFYNLWD